MPNSSSLRPVGLFIIALVTLVLMRWLAATPTPTLYAQTSPLTTPWAHFGHHRGTTDRCSCTGHQCVVRSFIYLTKHCPKAYAGCTYARLGNTSKMPITDRSEPHCLWPLHVIDDKRSRLSFTSPFR